MKISHSYKLFAVTIILLLTIIVIVVFKALNIQDDVTQSEQHRFRSFSLAMELFQSSEDLTRMACSYVSTGNPIYEKRYFDILDIRNGKQPRPANYNATYWHLAGVGHVPAVAQGETIALQELMRRKNFTEEEMLEGLDCINQTLTLHDCSPMTLEQYKESLHYPITEEMLPRYEC